MTETGEDGSASWEAIADGWTERVRTNTDWVRPLMLDAAHLSLLGDVAGKRMLDAGCGEGRFARMLAERGAEVVAVDLSQRMIGHAMTAEQDAPLGVSYIHGDVCELSSLVSSPFDTVVAYLSIIDVPDYETALREISGILRSGGQFVMSLVHPCFSPPVFGWEPRHPGTIPIRDADKLYRKVDRYFPAAEVRFKMWPTAPAETVNYHRPLTDYSRALRNAGLVVRGLLEPTPDPALAEQIDYFKGEFRAPTFIIFDCVKAEV